MRRSTIIILAAVVCLLVGAAALELADPGSGATRYHQHEQEPSEADLLAKGQEKPDTDGLCTHLPILRIDTGGQTIPGKPILNDLDERVGTVTGDNGETQIGVEWSAVSREGVWHQAGDPADQEGTALFRVRGNSSRYFDKSSYRLLLTKDGNPENTVKQPLLGMSAGKEWALYGPFLDKTLMRNYMWMNVAGEVMPDWVPNVRFCELILDGAYQGLYVLMEMIDVQEGRLELREYDDGEPVMSYLLRIEPTISPERAVENFTFYTYRMEPDRQMELLYPGRLHQSDLVKNYVLTNFSEVERMVFSGDSANWRTQVDLDSFVNYYILEEFLAVNDAFSASTYFYRDARGRLAIGPVWDLNNVLDNFFQPMPREGFLLSQRGWFGQLMKDETFVNRVIARYRELRKGPLSDEYLLDYIDEVQEYLGSAIHRNWEVWGYSFDVSNLTVRQYRRPDAGSDQTLEDVNPKNYEEAVEWMESYMTDRAAWMDQHINSLKQYCHPSRNN